MKADGLIGLQFEVVLDTGLRSRVLASLSISSPVAHHDATAVRDISGEPWGLPR